MARPSHPSDEQRRQVKSMAAFGLRETEIAQLIGIRSPKTLREHFRAKLGRGAGGPFSGVTRSGERMNVRLKACTPAEAKLIADILGNKRRGIETVELEAQIQALESTHVRPVYTAESWRLGARTH